MKSFILCSSICSALFATNLLAHSVATTAPQPKANLADLINTDLTPILITPILVNPGNEFDNLQPTIGVVSEEVARQRLRTYSVDQINSLKRVGYQYQINAVVDGVATDLEIDGLLGAVKNKATQLVIRPPFPTYERVMNFGEAIVAPELLSITDKQDMTYLNYKVRFYPGTNTYLGYNLDDGFMYIYNPDKFGNTIQPLAPVSSYLSDAVKEGF